MPSAIASTDEVAPQDYYPDLSAEDKELLKQLDATVDRMRTCLPDVPYVQTIPQDEPRYHHYSQQSAEQWLRETPFNRREHPNIQYQTWIYHEPHSNCIYLERSMRTEEAPQHLPVKSSAPQSAVGTPNVGPKKKISLAAYKNKQAGGADNTPEPQATENARAKAVKTEEQESKRTSERQGTVRKEAPAVSQTPKDSSAQNVLKRKRYVQNLGDGTRTPADCLSGKRMPTSQPLHHRARKKSPPFRLKSHACLQLHALTLYRLRFLHCLLRPKSEIYQASFLLFNNCRADYLPSTTFPNVSRRRYHPKLLQH